MDEEDAELEAVSKRRKIRQQQRQLKEDMDSVKDQLTNVKSDKFTTCSSVLNNIFTTVDHPREQQYDALAFKELSFAVKAQSANMADLSHRFDFGAFAAKVQGKYSRDGNFNWTDFGLDCGHIVTGVPVFETMLGPMKKEIKVRKVAVRKERERNTALNERPEEVEQDANESNEETNSRLKSLHKMIMQEDNDQVEPFDLLKLLIDPEDNVQTIENFFDFSFLVKNKLVVQDIDDETGLPIAMGVDPNKLSQAESNDKSQMILAINMNDLKQFARILFPEVESSRRTSSSSSSSNNNGRASTSSSSSDSVNPLHRYDELYEATSAKEQVAILRNRKEQQALEARQRKATSAANKAGAATAVGGVRSSGSNSQRGVSSSSGGGGVGSSSRNVSVGSSLGHTTYNSSSSNSARNGSSSTLDTTNSATAVLTAKVLSAASNHVNVNKEGGESLLRKRSAVANRGSPVTVRSAQENITPEGAKR